MEFALIILVLIFVVGPIARGYAERLARGALPPDVGNGDVTRLREEVDRLNQEVARLQEEQSFVMKLLESGRPKAIDESRHIPSDERTD